MTIMNEKIFEMPLHIDSVNDCNFYHTTDIPGVGVVERQWDLRNGIYEYLGRYDFSSKRVLEIGPAVTNVPGMKKRDSRMCTCNRIF